MFDIGFAELLIIAVVGLVVLGPDKLPIAARTVGLWVGKARRTLGGIQSEISEELRLDEMKRQVAMQKDELDKELNEMRQPFNEALGEDSPLANSVTTPPESSQPTEQSAAVKSAAKEQEKPKTDD